MFKAIRVGISLNESLEYLLVHQHQGQKNAPTYLENERGGGRVFGLSFFGS